MTVNTIALPIEKPGNGAATVFSFSPLRIFAETELEVVFKDTDGSLTTVTLGTGPTNYSVQADFPEDRSVTGSIIYPADQVTPIASGTSLIINPGMPYTQELALENQGGYLPALQEGAFDRAVTLLLQLKEEVDRSLRLAFGTIGVDTELPAPEAGKGLFWNATEDGLENLGVSPLSVMQTQNMVYDQSLQIGSPTHIDDLQEVINHQWSAGVIDGCDLIDNGDGTINIDTGYAMIRSSIDPHSSLYAVGLSLQTGLVLTDDATNYVSLDYNGGSPTFIASTSQSSFNCLDTCIAFVVHRDGNTLNYVDAREQNVDGNRKSRRLFLAFSRFIHSEGGTALSETGTLSLGVTAGSFYFMMNELIHVAFDTNVAGTENEKVFKLWYRDGAGSWTDVADEKTIDTTDYDDNSGTPATIPTNKYAASYVYMVNDDPSTLHVVMPQAYYNSQVEAENENPPSSIPTLLAGLSSIIGKVVYLESDTSFLNVLSYFEIQPGSTAATNHNALASLQGGAIGEYYHTTSDQNTELAVLLDGTGADTTILAGDKLAFYDISDSDDVKTDTVGGILDVQKSTANEYTKTQNFNATTLTDAATIAWDASANQVASVILAGNRTLGAPTNLVDGATYIVTVKQDATGSRTLAYNAVFKFSGGTAPSLSTGANDVDILTFISDGTNMYGVFQGEFS